MEPELNLTAYPKELEDAELDLIATRRGLVRSAEGDRQMKDTMVGFALSGGGIRSATFCLGVFQALARLKLLNSIDYMSAVSGGGYFASFLGRLFARPDVAGHEEVEEILTPAAANADEAKIAAEANADLKWRFRVFRWLRNNGRYLAPKGSGDVLLGLAVVLRNWFAIQIVLLTSLLAIFVALQLVRGVIEQSSLWQPLAARFANSSPWTPVLSQVFLSPYSVLAIAIVLFLLIPPGCAYWLVEAGSGNLTSPWLIWLTILMADLGLWWHWRGTRPEILSPLALLVTLAVGGSYLHGRRSAKQAEATTDDSVRNSRAARRLFINSTMRNVLSRRLRWGMVWTGAAFAFVLIDSIGQTIYANIASGRLRLSTSLSAALATLASLAGVARWIMGNLGFEANGKRPSVSMNTIAGAAAALVLLTLMVSTDALSHAVRWDFELPGGGAALKPSPPRADTSNQDGGSSWAAVSAGSPAPSDPPDTASPRSNSKAEQAVGWVIFAILVTLSFLFGHTWTFLNRSSQHAIYSARITRAYLGASNRARLDSAIRLISEVIFGDDAPQREYWRGPVGYPPMPNKPGSAKSLYEKRAPLHLVNVTVNQTFDPRTGTQQQDRKGMGMALGPAGVSLGVANHVVYDSSLRSIDQLDERCEHVRVFPPKGTRWRAFEYDSDPSDSNFARYGGEVLTLGDWTSISGAAFSTGEGYRTSLGVSILAGLLNVRLGYWWDSGTTDVSQRKLRKFLTQVFPVQTFLLKELIADFNGPEGRYWYLSDGGHFENLGAYELIRRRVKLCVIIDVGADADYTFEDLGNLVRKARLDFGAEIKFIGEAELDQWLPTETVRQQFGSLEQLRRGTWTQEPVDSPQLTSGVKPEKRLSIDPVDEVKESLRHAAFAEIRYQGTKPHEAPDSFLIYIKPTLIGDESADVRRYHLEHPSFPHESTLDQFFGEDQWESYRKLGEHIAMKIFGDCELYGGMCASFTQRSRQKEGTPCDSQAKKSSS